MALILGAGLSGLIAATQMPGATVLEANDRNVVGHRAVLRFRSDVLSRMTGIPFKKVTVRKSIWSEGRHRAPTIQLANLYSLKTNGGLLDRSIWNIDAVERFIAPEDLQHQMIEMIGERRIHWGCAADAATLDKARFQKVPIISTLPMGTLLDLLGRSPDPAVNFRHASICVDRYRIDYADVYQTIYFPDSDTSVYRASITGDMLIIERTGKLTMVDELADVLEAFGLPRVGLSVIDESHQQRYGKINPINEAWRRQTIFFNSVNFGIYSLGRFAVWKNILLDDVVHDVAVIKRLILSGHYDAALHNSKDRT